MTDRVKFKEFAQVRKANITISWPAGEHDYVPEMDPIIADGRAARVPPADLVRGGYQAPAGGEKPALPTTGSGVQAARPHLPAPPAGQVQQVEAGAPPLVLPPSRSHAARKG